MPAHRGESINCTEAEEHFLRRLGGAVIVHWDELSSEMQELLVQQAADMSDRHAMTQGNFQIRQFVAQHKGGN